MLLPAPLTPADWPVPVPAPVLTGRHVRLVPLAPEHDGPLLAAAADARTWTWMSRDVGTPEKLRAYLEAARAEVAAGTGQRFVVETLPERRGVGSGAGSSLGRIVGMVLLKELSRRDRRAESGTWLHPDAWGTGVNEEAKLLLLTHAFETLGCIRVEFFVAVEHARSRAALERLGAVEEGVLRSRRLAPDGRRFDHVIFGLLDRDWPEARARLETRLARKRGHAPTAPAAPPAFDPASDRHVGLWDEVTLWSALAGQLLLEHLPPGATRALDLGCGAGFPALELAERLGPSARVTGIDPWDAALRRAHAKRATWPVPNADLVRGDGASLPFRAASFDLVVSNLGVNNFEQPAATLAEARRVLGPGGTLALATNLVGHFGELYDTFDDVLAAAGDDGARERLRAHVAHRATVAGLGEALARAGLRVTATHERTASWVVRDGTALFAHHLIRMGFLQGWREVAGEAHAEEHLAALRSALDQRARIAGELRLTVPLAVLVARVD